MKKLTAFEFIKKAKLVHGDRYDYSQIKHVYASEKVKIKCEKHGEFEQNIHSHLKGRGCSACSFTKRVSKEKTNEKVRFIERAKQIHDNKYNYDNIEYVNAKTKIFIKCPVHGDFSQMPSAHLRGQGCPACGGKEKLSTEVFIKRAKQFHGDKYSYDKVNYINNSTKVIITCPIHGDFKQIPNNHMQNRGCDLCARSNSGKSQKYTTEQFIKKAKVIHSDKYGYDKVKYVNSNTSVIITCPVHGDFEQSPNKHLQKSGCPDCSGTKKSTTAQFIKKAIEIHGKDYFNYDKVNYINNSTKVTITCPFHGDFEQTPKNHLNKLGCKKCKTPKGEKEIELFLEKKKIKYANEYSFEDCRDKGLLRFDFAIFIDNKIGLIEYQGVQHYEEINFFRKKTLPSLETNRNRDKIKKEYAEKKKIPLLLISHKEFGNIENLIENFIAENLG